jgi:hypothetical protein
MSRFGPALGVAVGLLASSAHAQQTSITGPIQAVPAAGIQDYALVSPSSTTSNAIIMPSGQMEVAGEMAFVTADPWLGHPAIDFTDLALFRARVRRSFSKRLELFLGTELLAKQPAYLNEPVWQGADGGLRLAFSRIFAAEIGGGGGPLLAHAGAWWSFSPALLAKVHIGEYTRFVLRGGDSFTVLERQPRAAWLEELDLGGQAQWGDRHGALWLGIDYAVPFGWGPHASRSPAPGDLDPRVRVGLSVGGVLSVGDEGWDLYATYSIIDRGELNAPATTLPILDGGFDQRQMIFGVEHRFGAHHSRH